MFSVITMNNHSKRVRRTGKGDGSGSSDEGNAQILLVSTWYICRQLFVVSVYVVLHPPMIHRMCTTSVAIYRWLSHAAGVYVDISLVLMVLNKVWYSFGYPSFIFYCDHCPWKVTEWWLFRYLDGFYDIDTHILLFQRFCILPSPCWWSYLFIPTWRCISLGPIGRSDYFYCNPFLYVIINGHGW